MVAEYAHWAALWLGKYAVLYLCIWAKVLKSWPSRSQKKTPTNALPNNLVISTFTQEIWMRVSLVFRLQIKHYPEPSPALLMNLANCTLHHWIKWIDNSTGSRS